MLTNLADFSDGFTLVPDSGIQFVEFGFDFDASPRLSRSFIERVSPGETGSDGKTLIRLLPNWNDDDPDSDQPPHPPKGDDVVYDIAKSRALETFLDRWVPMPFFKIEPGKDSLGNEIYAQGPTDWVRVRVTETRNAHGDRKGTHRAIFAFDSSLAPRKTNRPYLAPCPEDAMRTESFRFVGQLPDIISFLSHKVDVPGQGPVDAQKWLDDWLRDILHSFKKLQRKGKELRPEDFPFQFEHLARYITFVQFIASVIKPVRVTLIDTVSDNRDVHPVDVDLVLDIGNSRSCGLLIQSFPDDVNVDLNNSVVLELRDLSKPELVYRDPFESQCELVAGEFGAEDIARRSGRPRAFFWPSLLRIGPEASRLRGESEGTEAATGLSSPKRYLWSSDPVLQEWKFRSASAGHAGTEPLIERSMYRFINDRGDVLEQLESDRRQFRLKVKESELQTASRFCFSRSSFFTFMLVEIIAQAMSMMNNPGTRRERRLKDSPRRLRRIILTIPSATPIQEQRILRSRAEAAVKLLWSLSGWGDSDSGINSQRPEIHCSWDEASSVHLVYLYGEAVHKLGGSIRTLFDVLGKERERPKALPPSKSKEKLERSLRVASVDVGGGTTDLMVTTYFQTDNVALFPDQNFREGFRIAGDDLLKVVIERLVIPRLEEGLVQAGLPNARNYLKDRFAGDNPNMSEQEKHLRRQFVLQVLQPIAIAVLSECEAMPSTSRKTEIRKAGSFFETGGRPMAGGDIAVDARILGYLKDSIGALGAGEFMIADCDIAVDPLAVEECVLSIFDGVFDNIAEAINHLDADVVLLTGRPMRLPQMISLFMNKMSVRPDRVIPIKDYRVGTWYPFRGVSNTHIDDPKTTAVVGAMLCALSERQITNFTLYSQYLRMKSTARYIGRLQGSSALPDETLLFSDIDLDAATAEAEAEFDYHSPLRIGFRQLPLERWVATPLYKLTTAQTRSARSVRKPVRVTIARNVQAPEDDEVNEIALLTSEATREEFVIQDAEDADGSPVKRIMELKLDTLAVEAGDGYWLDTGIISIQ
ncbi:virulence factor SrfB [Mesorhizobium kowhaii]|uniref:virulence factor SrfB n=1 Tax=Mesorhizobium kowhaii TaxID=1300272 RepID=UPI0035E5DEC8